MYIHMLLFCHPKGLSPSLQCDLADDKPTTPRRDDNPCENGGHHSSKRKSTGKNRRRSRRLGKRTSMALIDFSQLPTEEVIHDVCARILQK